MAAFHLPPRQKMINLIYVVLLAMMAINVSSDVMKGFSVLNMNTDRQISELGVRHRLLWEQCKEVGDSAIVQKADSIRMLTASLCRLSASLREKIIRQADGEDYVRGRLVKAEDMKAVPSSWPLPPAPASLEEVLTVDACARTAAEQLLASKAF